MATSELARYVTFVARRDNVGKKIGQEESVNWLEGCELSSRRHLDEKDWVALKERQSGSRKVAMAIIGVLVDEQPLAKGSDMA